MNLIPTSPDRVDNDRAKAYADLVALRQSLLDLEEAMNSLRLVNLTGMTALEYVELDLRGRTLEAQLRDHSQRYLQAVSAYQAVYLTGAAND
jgi:hypothetical protein